MAPQAKKNKGMVPLQTQRAKILRFHHSSHLGDLGVGRGGPKSAQKSLFFFFFFPPQKIRIMRCRIIRYMELFPCFCLLFFSSISLPLTPNLFVYFFFSHTKRGIFFWSDFLESTHTVKAVLSDSGWWGKTFCFCNFRIEELAALNESLEATQLRR